MPKRVDHTERRTQLAEAAVRAIDDRGLEAVRLVDVAKAANLTTGAVVHYLSSKDDVLMAAFDQVGLRSVVRMVETRGQDVVDRAMAYLPHDAETAREWRVFLQFWGRGVSDPAFRAKHRDGYEAISAALARELEAAGAAQPDVVADATIAIVDGIAVRVAMEPEAWPLERMRRTLAAALVPLFTANGQTGRT